MVPQIIVIFHFIQSFILFMKKGKSKFETPAKVGSDSEQTTTHGYSRISSGHRFSVMSENFGQSPSFQSYGPLTQHLGIKSQKLENLLKQSSLKRTLNRIILCKYLNSKLVLEQLQSIPVNKNNGSHNKGQPTVEQLIVNALIKKTKITPETSFLRSIVNLNHQQKYGKQMRETRVESEDGQNPEGIVSKKKLSYKAGSALTIFPQQHGPSIDKLKYGILALEYHRKQVIKEVINKFHKNSLLSQIKDRYILRLYRQYHENQRVFIQKVKLMARIRHDEDLQTKRRLTRLFLNKALQRREKAIFETIAKKNNSKEVIINDKPSQNKKEVLNKLFSNAQQNMMRSFYIWMVNSKEHKKKSCQVIPTVLSLALTPEPTSLSNFDEISQENQERRERILTSLHKMLEQHVLGRGFHRIKRRAHMIRMMEKCSIKLACGPKINVQRSLWRLNIHAFHQ